MKSVFKILAVFLSAVLCAVLVGCSVTDASSGGATGGQSTGAGDISVNGDNQQGNGTTQGGGSSQGSESAGGDLSSGTGDSAGEDSTSGTGEYVGVELTVEADGGVIRWNDVSAKVYEVTVGGEVFSTTETSFTPSGLDFGAYNVTVKAYLSIEPAVTVFATLEYIVKHPPIVAELKDGDIVWQPVEGATGYRIFLKGAFIAQISECSYTPQEDGYYSVSVVFEDEAFNSEPSEPVAVGTVAPDAPSVFIEGGVLTWQAVVGAEMYCVRFNGENKISLLAEEGECSYDLKSVWREYAADYPDGVTVTVVAYSSVGGYSQPSNSVQFNL